MRAGLLRHRVTIRTMQRTPDGMGGYTETPVDVATVHARVVPLDGREQLQAMQTGMVRPHRFEMRYRSDLTAMHEILFDGRRFDVKSVVDVEGMQRELHVLADEIDD